MTTHNDQLRLSERLTLAALLTTVSVVARILDFAPAHPAGRTHHDARAQ